MSQCSCHSKVLQKALNYTVILFIGTLVKEALHDRGLHRGETRLADGIIQKVGKPRLQILVARGRIQILREADVLKQYFVRFLMSTGPLLEC